jgi:hypothetical protein
LAHRSFNDPAVVDDEAGIPAALPKLVADIFEAIVEAAGWNILADVGPGARLASVITLER